MESKAVPQATPETQTFWDRAGDDELWVQRCHGCEEAYFYPRPSCPQCGSGDVEWIQTSGRAVLHSYIINYRAAPGFENDVPYVIALVRLDEGPQMMTNIVGIEPLPENLILDMILQVTFIQRGEISLPVFEPAAASDRKAETNAR